MLLSFLPLATRGQTIGDIDLSGLPKATQAKSLRYWFDDDGGNVYAISTTSGNSSLDISSLVEGLHTLHFQVVDNEGSVAYISSAIFLKIGSTIDDELLKAVKLSYWFDNETAIRQSDMTGKVQMIDASMLTDGLHTIHYQALCNNGALTAIKSSIFLRLSADTEISSVKSLRYWFDDGQNVTEISYTSGVQTFDVSALVEGLHTIHCQTIDDRGGLGVPYSSIFLKMDTGSTSGTAQSIRYWFDDEDLVVKTTDIANGTQVLDVSELKTGVHTLCYQLVDSNGNVSTPKTGLFMKFSDKVIADGQNRIIEYQYWVNRNSQSMKTVKVNDAVNPYTLISLLPMQKEPIHSDFFHFEITNGQPMIYAKNVFHIRFHDAAGYFVDGDKPYVDYSVKQEVTDVEILKSGVRATTERPTENAIKWYQLDAESGDSLQFKLDRAATIQLFAPSGKEVHSVSGAESVKWNGLHAKETGTFYLALHDVTATQGTTINIDYNHIDKYAVLRQDVDVVGNGGVSTITFDGNGFRDLYAIDLYNEQGDTIKSEAIGLQNDAVVSITFDFTDVSIGVYDAVFHFTTEKKKIKNIVTVEEAKDIELALDVKYPSTFLRGTSTTYAITVTNKGNSTAYDVPMEIYLSAGNSISNISSVKFKDEKGKQFNNFTLADIDIERDSLDDEAMVFIEEIVNELNGLQSFIVMNDSATGGEYGFTDQLLTISPNRSLTFYIEIRSSAAVKLNVRIPGDWITVNTASEVTNASSGKRRSLGEKLEKLCCEKEKWECIVSVAADVVGLIPGMNVVGCAFSLVDLGTYTVFEIACADGYSLGSRELSFYRSVASDRKKMESVISKIVNSVLGCFGARILKRVKELAKKMHDLELDYKLTLAQADNYSSLYKNNIDEYDRLMRTADQYYKQGNIIKAEEIEKEALFFRDNADTYKMYADIKRFEADQLLLEMNNVKKLHEAEKKKWNTVLSNIYNGLNLVKDMFTCAKERLDAKANCPPNPKNDGGISNPVTSRDPNEILGYVAESGSKAVKDGLTGIYYTIQFENDTVFATAPAHDIYLTDTLDVNLFDLSSYRPTKIKIGEKSLNLTGERNFISTLDMRPEINAIAQIEGMIDDETGVVRWHISSLDPMTMEPVQDAMVGVLPVNFDGSGMGEASFDISLKNDLPHGTEISNRSGNIFDSNETILTPAWTNVIDRISPTSRVTDVQQLSDTMATVSIKATDELSGPWRYDVYVQYGRGSAWWKAAENVPVDTTATVKIYDGIDHGFYVVVTDSAGNVERKQAMREMTLNLSTTVTGDVNGDSQVGIADIVAVTSYMAGNSSNISLTAADVNGDGQVGIADIIALTDIMAGTANVKSPQLVRNKTYFIRRKTKEQ